MTTTTPTSTTKKKPPWSKIALGVVLTILLGLQVAQFEFSRFILYQLEVLEWKQKIEDRRIENMVLKERLENYEKFNRLEELEKQLQKDQ